MALIKCPECGKAVSDKAEACPNCGFPVASSHPEGTWGATPPWGATLAGGADDEPPLGESPPGGAGYPKPKSDGDWRARLFGFVLFTLLILLSYFLWDTYDSF